MAQHTLGPWRATLSDGAHIIQQDRQPPGGIIATVWTYGTYPVEGNAHLIAAAPDLLAACNTMLTRLSELIGDRETPDDEDVEMFEQAEAAIAKARGEEA